MRPRPKHIAVAALVLVLSRAAVDQGVARVILDGTSEQSNPAVEQGGRHLPPQPPPVIPYSLIGAIASEGRWLGQCAMWQWGLLRSFAVNHRAIPSRPVPIQPGGGGIAPRLP